MAGQMMPSDRPIVCRRSCGAVTLRIAARRRGAACSVRTSMATTGPYHRATRLFPDDRGTWARHQGTAEARCRLHASDGDTLCPKSARQDYQREDEHTDAASRVEASVI